MIKEVIVFLLQKLVKKKVDEIFKFYLGPIYNLRRKLGDKDFSELMYFIEMANKKIGEEGELE